MIFDFWTCAPRRRSVVPSSVVDGGRRVHDVAAEEDREGRGVEEGERVLSSFHAIEPASFWLQELSVALE